MRKSLLTLTLLSLLSSPAALAQEAPRVLVSIKPLHGLVASVMRGVGEPGLIVQGTNAPHGYALKPSDLKALEQAELVVWVGKDFETWLSKPLAKVKNRLAMRDLPGLTLLPSREGGVWESHDHDKAKAKSGHHHHHKDHDEEIDGHVWLDPDNAAKLVDAVAIRLKAMAPAHAARIDANAAETKGRLSRLDADLAARLLPVASKPYVVFHDAQQYFEKRYGLSAAGAMTVDPDRPLGAKRLAALRDRLKSSNAVCVFREPGFGAEAARTLAEASGTRVGELDPEGTRIDPGPDAYDQLLSGLGASIADCLSGR